MNRNVPWSILNVSKLIITGALILLTIIDLCMAASYNSRGNIYPVDYYTPLIKIVSFVSWRRCHFVNVCRTDFRLFRQIFAGILLICNKKNGLRTSGLLFLFWFFLFILSIPQCRSEVRRRAERLENGENDSWAEYNYISFMIFFTLTTLVWLLNWFADSEPLQTKYPKTSVSHITLWYAKKNSTEKFSSKTESLSGGSIEFYFENIFRLVRQIGVERLSKSLGT